MISGITKRIVVIKNIPSNVVEEAILILKGETEGTGNGSSDNGIKKGEKKDKDFLVKEAYSIINNYLKDFNVEKCNKKIPDTIPISKTGSKKQLVNTFINMALIGSFALLIFIISRLI